MGTIAMNKIEGMTFKRWCRENRWSAPKLQRELIKYGAEVSTTTIWYWMRGIYRPREQKVREVLSHIVGFDCDQFVDFRKKSKIESCED